MRETYKAGGSGTRSRRPQPLDTGLARTLLKCTTGAIAVSLGLTGLAAVHHGITARFDTSTTFEIAGVVTGLEFVNPHACVYFDVTGDSGEIVPWRCESRAATGPGEERPIQRGTRRE